MLRCLFWMQVDRQIAGLLAKNLVRVVQSQRVSWLTDLRGVDGLK